MPRVPLFRTSTLVARLAKVPLLSGLSRHQLRQLAKVADTRDFPADTPVVRQGERGLGFYFIVKGLVTVRRAGRPVVALGPGEFFGELALFHEGVRSADVVTEEPSTAVVLSRQEFWKFADVHPEVLKTILAEMARRLESNEPTEGKPRGRPLRTARGLAP